MYLRTITNFAPLAQRSRGTLLATLLTVTACHRLEVGGQTLATVNGQPITTSEFRAELANIAPAMRDRMKGQILQAMIDRRLLAEDAEAQKVDKNPGFVLQERRMREMLRAQWALQSYTRAAQQPVSQTEVNAYLDRHPNIGANRLVLLVDQVQFQTPAQPVLDALKPTKSLDALIDVLRHHGVAVQRGRGQIDTAALPDDALAKIASVSPGEPLIAVNGPNATASAIIQQQAAPLDEAGQQKVAHQRIDAERNQTAIKQRSDALRRAAAIDYAEGYAPSPRGRR